MESKEKEKIKRIAMACFEDEVNPEIEWKRLLKKIDSRKQYRLPGKKNRSMTFLKYAVAVCAGILISFSIKGFIQEDEPYLVTTHYKLHTDKGEKSYLELPDGTKIWLNSYTTIEYAPSYGIDDRTIYLNGEAYFEVAKNKELPFIVKAHGVDIKALGTSFNVSAYSEDAEFVTTLFSGQVAIQSALTKQEVILDPNQIAVYYQDQNRIEKKVCKEHLSAQWRNGTLAFEMMYLQDITKILERNYNVVFCYENQHIKKLRFSGSFQSNETIQEIMKVIMTNTLVDYQLNKDTILIK